MIKMTILYGNPTDPEAFERYYAQTHLPISANLTGMSRIELTRFGPGMDGGQPAYHRMVELYFPTEAQMQATFSSPAGQAVAADVPKFATGGVTMLVGSVVG